MMKKLTALLSASLLIAMYLTVNAQNFAVVGTGIKYGSVAGGTSEEFTIYISNTVTPAGDLFLSWNTVSTTIPTGWTISLCDNFTCYGSIPLPTDIKNMDTVNTGGQGFFKFTVTPNTVDSGILKLNVFNSLNPSEADTVEFHITGLPVGISENKISSGSLAVFPNPAKDFISLKLNNSATLRNVSVFDILGNEVMNLNSSSRVDFGRLNVSALQAGVYIIKAQDKDGIIYSRRMYKSN